MERAPQESSGQKFKVIRGNVKDEEGAPLPGVTVMIKGTTMGVSTDAAGNFVLDMPDGYQVLQFSFIGMETQEVKLGGTDTQVNVVLKMAVGQLDEVIVSTGYTLTDSKKTTGSVAVVGERCLKIKSPHRSTIIAGTGGWCEYRG